MKFLMMLLSPSLLLAGCSTMESFWNKEFVAVYTPETMRKIERSRIAEPLNSWLGQSKSERIRVIGSPNKCTALNTGEEICEWVHIRPSSEQHVTFTYDRGGLARTWSYRGTYGQFTNATYDKAEATSTASSQSVSQQEKKWTHPAKAESEFSPDYFHCQNFVQQDSQGQVGLGNRYLLQDAIESCLKQHGWVSNEKR